MRSGNSGRFPNSSSHFFLRAAPNRILMFGDLETYPMVPCDDFRVVSDKLVIEVSEQLIGVESAYGRENPFYGGIGKGFVNIVNPGLYGGGSEEVHFHRVF